uniref:Uncharacterized protein n=1 Tax=Amphimedon queenslandica TaxID=400682 RepID=A0A1X7VFQ8_AMPQE
YSYKPTGSAAIQAEGNEIEERLLVCQKPNLATEIQLIIKKDCSINVVHYIDKEDSYYIGKYIAMSITQGGSGFLFFCQGVNSFVTTGACTHILVENHCIPNSLIFIIEMIQQCDDDSELRVITAIEEAADLILQTGYRKPLS